MMGEVLVFGRRVVLDVDMIAPHAPADDVIGISISASTLLLSVVLSILLHGTKLRVSVLRTRQQFDHAPTVVAELHRNSARIAHTD
jgi:hypothetical protein